MLRPGGTMVYSTCTFNDTENEGVLRRFLALHPEFSLAPFALPGLPEAKDGYLHLYPHEVRGEGHFVSRLKKAGEADESDAPVQAVPQRKAPARAAAKGKAPASIALPDVFSDVFAPERLYTAGDALWMLPEGISIERLSGLRVLRTGLLLAHAEGKRSEPDHALAMALRPEEAARTASLTQAQALAYQAGETLSLGDLPGGYTLLCCEGVSLGWGQAGGRPDEKPLSQGSAAKMRAGCVSAEVCKRHSLAHAGGFMQFSIYLPIIEQKANVAQSAGAQCAPLRHDGVMRSYFFPQHCRGAHRAPVIGICRNMYLKRDRGDFCRDPFSYDT